MKQYSKIPWFFVILFILAIVTRLFFFYTTPQYIIYPDTFSYAIVGSQIIENPTKYLINPDRTPLYPLFLRAIAGINGNRNASLFSYAFKQAFPQIVLVQSFFGLLTIFILIKLIKLLHLPEILSKIILLFLATNILIFKWEQMFLTESFSIFLLTSFVYIAIKSNRNHSGYNYILMTFLSLTCLLLKPGLVYLPFIAGTLLVISKPKKITLLFVTISLLIVLTTVSIFTKHNEIYFSYRGLNRAKDINLLGNILKYNLDVEIEKDIGNWSKTIVMYRKQKGDPMPYKLLDYYYLLYSEKDGTYASLAEFNQKVISKNLRKYILSSIILLPKATLDIGEFLPYLSGQDTTGVLLASRIYLNFLKITLYLNLLTIPFLIVWIYQFIKKKSETHLILVMLGSISTTQILSSILLSYGEYGRLISPVYPILSIFNFVSILYVFSIIKKYIKHHFQYLLL